jgi:hypothetical protein
MDELILSTEVDLKYGGFRRVSSQRRHPCGLDATWGALVPRDVQIPAADVRTANAVLLASWRVLDKHQADQQARLDRNHAALAAQQQPKETR